MKKLLFILILCCADSIHAQYTEWHVKPHLTNNAAITGDGKSFETAWTIQNALNNPGGVIKPGDVVWLHNGTYSGMHYESLLQGTAEKYIKVASYPGEWAVLNGNIYPYVTPVVPPPGANAKTEETALENIELEANSYLDADEDDQAVLKVVGGFVSFENFEISCVGNINRLLISDKYNLNCDTSNGFHKMAGIGHSTNTKNRFINLVIRNIPGTGIGSWKYTMDSEIYGCLIYNNGYINNSKQNCAATEYDVIGKGYGIYTQNIQASPNRIIENNIFHNNYDSGIAIWSGNSNPVSNFLNNYTVSNNVFINNGGPQRDESPNMKIMSASSNAFNHPSNINIDRNIFYLSSRSDNISGLVVKKTNGVNITNNHIFKGTAGSQFQSDNYNLNYNNNFYWGKYNQYYISPTDYLSHNWNFHSNTYYAWNTVQPFVCQILNPNSTGLSDYFRRVSLETFKMPLTSTNGYNGEFNSLGPFGVDVHGNPTGQYVIYGDAWYPPNTLSFASGAYGPHIFNKKTFVTQNKYNNNVFYVVAFDPRASSNDNILVDLSSYNIPSGTNYKIKDAENYFGPVISGNLTGNSITFAMNSVLGFEKPTGILGIDYTTEPIHAAKDVRTYVVEFGCNDVPYDKTIADSSISGISNHNVRNFITLGSNFTVSNTGNSTIRAGRQIVLKANSHIKNGASFLGKIENACPDLVYVGEAVSFKQSDTNATTETLKQDLNEFFVVYPNPNSGVFNIKSTTSLKVTKATITELNSGKSIYESEFKNQEMINIDISHQRKGLYLIQVYFEDHSTHVKTISKN